MKRNFKLVLGAIMVAGMLSVTGCGNSNSNNAGAEGEISQGDATEFSDMFTAGLEAIDSSESVTISTDVKLAMSGTDLPIESSNQTLIKRVVNGEGYDANVDLTNNYGTETSQISASYTDGFLYFESEGEYLKEAMTYDDLMSIVNSYSMSFKPETMSNVSVTEGENNTTVYNVEFDMDAMSTMMQDNLESFGSVFANDENMDLEDCSIEATFDKDSQLLGYNFNLNAKYTNGEETNPFEYTTVAEFSDINNTEVTLPEDLSIYTDVAELETETTEGTDGTAEEVTAAVTE